MNISRMRDTPSFRSSRLPHRFSGLFRIASPKWRYRKSHAVPASMQKSKVCKSPRKGFIWLRTSDLESPKHVTGNGRQMSRLEYASQQSDVYRGHEVNGEDVPAAARSKRH